MKSFLLAWRLAFRNKAFTLFAVLTLALGIGANSAIYSLIHTALLNPFPYPKSGQIMQLGQSFPESEMSPLSYPDYLIWRERQQSFAAIGFISGKSKVLTGSGDSISLRTAAISADTWKVLGM
jgi:putative ABC transport system permease protein